MEKYIKKVELINNPILKASDIHFYIAQIHPFFDGNDRTARLMSNLILKKDGYLPFLLTLDERDECK